MKKEFIIVLITVMVMASSSIAAYADGIQIENDLESNHSLTNNTNDAVSYEKLEGEFQNAATTNLNGNTYIVYYNDEITTSTGYKYKIHGIISSLIHLENPLYLEVEFIEQPPTREVYVGWVPVEVTKNDVPLEPTSWDADFLYYSTKGRLSAWDSYYHHLEEEHIIWALAKTANKYIESGNTIKIYIRSK